MWVSHPFYILLTIHEPSRGTEILLNKDSFFYILALQLVSHQAAFLLVVL